MRELTKHQKNFLLEHFFKNTKYLGWKSIAESLLEDGECIVAGDKCIWWNCGIGNFIKTEDVKNAFGCLLYKFNLDYFLSSSWYKDMAEYYIAELLGKKLEIEQEYADLIQL